MGKSNARCDWERLREGSRDFRRVGPTSAPLSDFPLA